MMNWETFFKEINFENIFKKELRNLVLCNYVVSHPYFFKIVDEVHLQEFLNYFPEEIKENFTNLKDLRNINFFVNPPVIHDESKKIKRMKIWINDSKFICLKEDKVKKLFTNKSIINYQLKNEDFFNGIDAIEIRDFMMNNQLNLEYCFLTSKVKLEDFWNGLDKCQTLKEKSDFSMTLLRVLIKNKSKEHFDKKRLFRYAFINYDSDEIREHLTNQELLWLSLVPKTRVIKDFDKFHDSGDMYKPKSNHQSYCAYCNLKLEDFPNLNLIKEIKLKEKDFKGFGIVNRFMTNRLIKLYPFLFRDYKSKKLIINKGIIRN